MGRLVAVKVIRPEHLREPNAIRRFQREIRAAAQLHHPNIVLAHDAAQIGNTFLLVMEYIEGADLSRLVAQKGPLPVGQACDYVRQAALGLQHAARAGHGPPRHQAEQSAASEAESRTDGAGHGGQGSRPWSGAAAFGQRRADGGRADEGRHGDGHAGLHRSGAGPGIALRGHPRRHLQSRLHSVSPVDGSGALPRRHSCSEARQAHDARARTGRIGARTACRRDCPKSSAV